MIVTNNVNGDDNNDDVKNIILQNFSEDYELTRGGILIFQIV